MLCSGLLGRLFREAMLLVAVRLRDRSDASSLHESKRARKRRATVNRIDQRAC